MSLDIDSTSNLTSGTGSWFTFDNNFNYLNSGRFIATNTEEAVPEPLTVLGSLTAMGFGIAFKRKSRGQK